MRSATSLIHTNYGGIAEIVSHFKKQVIYKFLNREAKVFCHVKKALQGLSENVIIIKNSWLLTVLMRIICVLK